MSRGYTLDSFALLAYLRQEPGYPRVLEVLQGAQAGQWSVYLSLINYGEVLYISERLGGRRAVEETVRIVDNLPLEIVAVDRPLTFQAAHIKAHYRLSFADAFTVALALEKGVTILTGDPEFQSVEGLVEVEWLKTAP